MEELKIITALMLLLALLVVISRDVKPKEPGDKYDDSNDYCS